MQPFRDIDLGMSLISNKQKMAVKVDSFKNEEIMANDLKILANNLYEEFRIEPVEIMDEEFNKRHIGQAKIKRIDPFLQDFYGKEYTEVDGIVMPIKMLSRIMRLCKNRLYIFLKRKSGIIFSVANMFEVPVKKSAYAETYVPLQRKIVPIAHEYKKKDVYSISDANYADILATLKHMGSTYRERQLLMRQ